MNRILCWLLGHRPSTHGLIVCDSFVWGPWWTVRQCRRCGSILTQKDQTP